MQFLSESPGFSEVEVRGFAGKVEGGPLDDLAISQFLDQTFGGLSRLQSEKIRLVRGDPRVLLFTPDKLSQQATASLVESGRLEVLHAYSLSGKDPYFVLAPDIRTALEAECLIEGVDTEKLKHSQYRRAQVNRLDSGKEVVIYSLGLVDFPRAEYSRYVSDLDTKMLPTAYLLGLLVHEFAHVFDKGWMVPQTRQVLFHEVCNADSARGAPQYISDYARSFEDISVLPKEEAVNFARKEDLADSVRLYTLNADFLAERFPHRYTFVQEKFPFVKRNAVRAAVERLFV